MDQHRNIAAAIAIIEGLLGLMALLVVFLFFGGIAYIANMEPAVAGLMMAVGGAIAVFVGTFTLLNVIAGISYLRSRSTLARAWLAFHALMNLFGFPIGTVIGGYTLWAILRDCPEDHPGGVVAQAPTA